MGIRNQRLERTFWRLIGISEEVIGRCVVTEEEARSIEGSGLEDQDREVKRLPSENPDLRGFTEALKTESRTDNSRFRGKKR